MLLMTPILEGLDGVAKMSKSLGNDIPINDPPQEIYGKVMSISDLLMWNYYELLTDLSQQEIQELKSGVESGAVHPMKAKGDLAVSLVSDFHSEGAAQEAQEHFTRVFQEGEVPEGMPTFSVRCGGQPVPLPDLVLQVEFAPSKSEARRLIRQAAVSIDGEKIEDPSYRIDPKQKPAFVLRVGKRKFGRITLD